MNKCTVLFSNSIIDCSGIKKAVETNCNIELTFLQQKNLGVSDEVIIIAFELAKNLAYNASYDLVRFTILSLLSNVRFPEKKKTKIIITNNGVKSELVFPFELTEEQKQQCVDASIQKILS